MFRLYSPIFILQIFCLYHVYTHSKDYKWYLLIFFLPLLGSLIYLYIHFFNRQNLDLVSDTVQDAFTIDPKLKKLQRELEFSDTVKNRLNLADEYLNRGQSKLAKELYEQCLEGAYKDDPSVLIRLLDANFLEGHDDEVVRIGTQLKNNLDFSKSRERVSYALALQATDQIALAEQEFQQMDVSYANYYQRLSYARFLHSTGKESEANAKIDELVSEIEQMNRLEKRFNNDILREIKLVARKGF